MVELLKYQKFLVIWLIGALPIYVIKDVDLVILCWCLWLASGIYYLVCASKMTQILNTTCWGVSPKSFHGSIVVFLSYITLGIFGYFWLKNQVDRMENKKKEYIGKSIDRRLIKIYIGWFSTWVFAYGMPIIVTFVYALQEKNYIENATEQDIYNYNALEHMAFLNSLSSNIESISFVALLASIVLQAYFIYLFAKEINELAIIHNDIISGKQSRKQNIIEEDLKKEPQKEFDKKSGIYQLEPTTIQDDSVKHYSLVCKSGVYEGAVFPLEGDSYIMIGRDGQNANIVINDSQVSRLHCQIRYNKGQKMFEVTDHSSVGTFVNGEKITPKTVFFCPIGSYIQLGTSNNVFELHEERMIL